MEDSAQQPPFDQLCRQLSDPLLRYLSRYVGDPALAEDLRQETLLRIARALPAFEGRSDVKTWAFSIATHVAADYFRATPARLAVVEMDESVAPAVSEDSIDEPLIVDEMSACVREVIEHLPLDYRNALILHDLENLTAAQTAAACGCSVATAKIRIHRARARLREALTQECNFYHCSDNTLRCDRKG